ncbi:MAG: SpoIIE family protein phosphatase [Actinomycetota bacterium]|nr:SpoIIE family protein phosphatase [Actinomycetota bacterium]MDH5223959.1 SpoIIE family protein phosphatase [Actinomycetota bacterium]MDH5313293.1 SpoIIE family protein phosphatase [Actinomycetota bacterium]
MTGFEMVEMEGEEPQSERPSEVAAVQLRRLQCFADDLASASTVDELIALLFARTQETLGTSAGALMMARKDLLDVVASYGYPEEALRAFREVPIDAPLPACEAARTRRPVVIENHHDYIERFPEAIGLAGPAKGSVVAFPLIGHGELLGVLGLRFPVERRFGPDDIELIAGASQQFVFAHRRLELLERERGARGEAELSNKRLSFLASASREIASSLDYERTLATVSRMAVPELADWCAVDLVDPDGTIRQLAVSHVDPAKVSMAIDLRKRYPPDPDASYGVPAAIRSGRSELIEEIPAALLEEVGRDRPELRDLIEDLQLHSSMVVPLMLRGRAIGAITFVMAESGRRYTPLDLDLAEELAVRAATAIGNARLYGEQRSIADTLQHSLLPPAPPEIPGYELAVAYRPAGDGTQVGGDFYDVFEIDGSWLLVVGDVCGKGSEAAAIMAMSRYAIRTASLQDTAPATLLSTLNETLVRQYSGERFTTAAMARLGRGDDGSFSVSVAGHPLPYALRSDGSVQAVGQPGTLLGIFPDPTLHDVELTLDSGDALVLYTDGVTDARRGSEQFGNERLRAALAAAAGRSPDAIVAAVLDAVLGFTQTPGDDIALMVLRAP